MATTTAKPESQGMRFFRKLGQYRLAWSLRRLHVPVHKEALVLEIGSGGNPYPRANVLLDAHEETIERWFTPLVKDRPLVLGIAERLPFKDKSFDFIIASHVLEHSTDPDSFLCEIQRVGKAGYIEAPDAFFEKIIPYTFHRLEITEDNSQLIINKKTSWCPDPELAHLHEKRVKRLNLTSKFPFEFHVRFYWEDKIEYKVINAAVLTDWELPEQCIHEVVKPSWRYRIRLSIIPLLRWLFSQKRRNRNIDLISLLICPTCRSESIKMMNNRIVCNACTAVYPMKGSIPLMYPKAF